MNSFKLAVQHPKTTIGGVIALLGGISLLLQQGLNFLNGQPISMEAISAAVAAVGAGYAGIVAKDADKTNSASPVAVTKVAAGLAILFALGFAAPAFAHSDYSDLPPAVQKAMASGDIQAVSDALAQAEVDPTTSTVDSAGPADAVANAPQTPRWSFSLGKLTVSPSTSFTPTVLSLKDFSISIGPNVGAGLDWVWANGYGAATHVTLRETSSGMKPLGSLYGILPFLQQYKLRPGLSYQIGGGAESWKDAFIFGIAVSDNFGFAAK